MGIVTDSAAGITTLLPGPVPGLQVVRLPVLIDGREITCGSGGLEPAAAADSLADENEVLEKVAVAAAEGRRLSTSRPGPEAFAQAYRELACQGCEHVVAVHLSGQLSGTVSGARAAAAEAPLPVTVVDSGSVALGQAAAVLAALHRVGSGHSPSEVAQAAGTGAAELLFTVPTLEYLGRSGRIPKAWAVVGQMLGIKPIGIVVQGRLRYLERPRTLEAAERRMVELVLQRLEQRMYEPSGSKPVLVLQESHPGPAPTELIHQARDRWGEDLPVICGDLPTALTVHTGLGAWAAGVLDAQLLFGLTRQQQED